MGGLYVIVGEQRLIRRVSMDWRYEVLTHTVQTDDVSMNDLQGTLQHMANQARNNALELVTVTSIPRQSGEVEVVMFFKKPLESESGVSAEEVEAVVNEAHEAIYESKKKNSIT
jgi:hypothetical protein